jgi:hypothetical protein
MKKIKIILSAIVLTGSCIAQTPFKTNGNNLFSGDYLGSNNNQDLDIKTNGQLRLKINSNGKIIAKDNVTVQGIMKADSIVSLGGAHIFGQLHVGNSSLVSGTSNIPILHDYQTTSTGNLILGHADPYNFPLPGPNPISAFRLGIGIQIPQFKVHISDVGNVSNFISLSNSSTGYGVNDGFGLGIITGIPFARICNPCALTSATINLY